MNCSFIIEKKLGRPYKEICQLILREIESGRWQLGDRLGTMKDLSQEFDTSLVTLDRALRELVSEGVLLHEPNKGVRLAGQSHGLRGTIMLVVHSLNSATSFPDFVAGAEQIARSRKYHVGIFCIHNQVDMCLEAVKRAVCLKVKGVIYAPGGGGTDFRRNSQALDYLRVHHIPVVLAGHCDLDEALSLPRVASDHEKAARVLAAHLVRMGCRRFRILGTSPNSDHERIFDGFRSVLEENGIAIRSQDIQFVPDMSWVAGAVRQIWAASDRPDVIFAIGDDYAAATLQCLREMNVNVPDEVAVVGFGDYPICRFLAIPLTTMHIRHKEEGALAAGLLIDTIEGRTTDITQIDVPCDLVVRQSCGAGHLPALRQTVMS